MTAQRDIRYKFKDASARIYLPELFAAIDKSLAPGTTDEQHQDAIFMAEAFVKKNADHEKLMRQYLEALYHPDVVLALPDVVPPYDNSSWKDFDMAPANLQNALGHLHYFVKGTPSFISTDVKRENFYIQTVEALYRRDSKLYDSILLKQFPKDVYKNLGIEFFYKVYPGYFKGINVEAIAAMENPEVKKPVDEPVEPEAPKPKATPKATKATSTPKKATTRRKPAAKKATTKKAAEVKKDG